MPDPDRVQPVFFLAFDHRGEFARSVLDADPATLTAHQSADMRRAKSVIFSAAMRAFAAIPGQGSLGVLIDEEYAGEAALQARERGIVVAMPVEAPDRAVFDFEYGPQWREHIERFEPTYAKVLVRYNVEGDHADNAVQRGRLGMLSQWLSQRPTKFMFELVVPPTAEQARHHDYETVLRPQLIRRAIAELQDAGIEPDTWKLEGIDRAADAREVARQATSADSRTHVTCIVLGAGGSKERVRHWLRVAAAVDGYAGFAIGRSIWRAPIRKHLAGELNADQAASDIAERYLDFVDTYRGAAPLSMVSGGAE